MADIEVEPLLGIAPQYYGSEDTAYRHTTKDLDIKQQYDSAQLSQKARRIGWGSAYILVISRVIGSGIFAMPGTIVHDAGSPGLALLLWVVGAFIAWCGLAIDLEYGCMLPRSGGEKVYLEFTYPRPRFLASTLVAVQAILLGFTASNCIVFAKYMIFAAGAEPDDFNTKILAVGLLTAITIVHGYFYRTGIWIQNILGWLKIGLILFMILTGFIVVVTKPTLTPSKQHLKISNLFKDSNWNINNLSTLVFKILYSYAGLNNLNNVMDEIKNPVRTLKTVGPIALITACFLYLLINIAYLVVVPFTEIKQSQELIAALFFEKIFGHGFGDVVLPVAIALGAAGNVMVVTFSLARLNQEILKQGLIFPSPLQSSNTNSNTHIATNDNIKPKPRNSLKPQRQPTTTTQPSPPIGGLLIHYIPSLLVITLPPSKTVYAFIAEVEGYAGQFFALAIAIGLLYLRYKKPDLRRPFKAWRLVVWVKVVLCLVLIFAPFVRVSDHGGGKEEEGGKGGAGGAVYAFVGGSILLFGVVYWFIWTIVLPYLGGYKLEEIVKELDDGTSVNKVIRVRK